MAEKAANTKRQKISKAQQLTMIEVLGASLVLGTCLVLVNFIIQYIKFNSKVLTEKDKAIAAYDQTIRNIGICADKDRNGRLSDDELKNCDPNAVQLSEVPNSLRYNVFESMAQNKDLESVARKRNENCYDEEGNRIDFNALYNLATDEGERQQLLQATKICSALRVIPDALPARKNTEALMASLNQIFITSQVEPEVLAPRDDVIVLDELTGVEAIPVTLGFRGKDATVLKVLDNINRSIRNFDITSMSVEWIKTGLNVTARANAYYTEEAWGLETEQTVRAGASGGSKK